MARFYIKIISAKNALSWYANSIGEIFAVYELYGLYWTRDIDNELKNICIKDTERLWNP